MGQVLEHVDYPKNIEDFVLGERNVVLICPRYNVDSGKFEGFYKALRELIVRSDQRVTFLDYGSLKSQSEILSSAKKNSKNSKHI